MRIRQSLSRRARRWAARRDGTDTLPHTVTRRRIYIIPTRFGTLLAALLFAMVIAGLNYGSNLALGFAFLMAGVGIVAMHHCHRNLLGLRIEAAVARDAFAGGEAALDFTLRGDGGFDRYDLEIRCEAAQPELFHLAADDAVYAHMALPCERRGILELAQWELRTRHPFGWFRAWTYVHAPLRVYVAPAPAGEHAPVAPPGSSEARSGMRRGEDEFAGLRPYRPGDALKHMAWKVIARGREAAVRQYAQGTPDPEWLNYDALAGLDPEARLSQLCRWLLERDARGSVFGLKLPGVALQPARGPAHRRACMRALAGFRAV